MSKFYRVLLILTVILTVSLKAYPSQWKLHSTFDKGIESIVDTPDAVYFLCHGDKYEPAIPQLARLNGFLYMYDKQADELLNLTAQNKLSETIVNKIKYNPEGEYLVVVYSTGNIDLLYDDGRVVNIPDIKVSDVTPKNLNDIAFDNKNSIIYIATSFGYVSIDEKSGLIKDTRIYNKNFSAVATFKNRLVVSCGSHVYSAPLDKPKYMFEDFQPVENLESVFEFMHIKDSDRLYCVTGNKAFGYTYFLTEENDSLKLNGPLFGYGYSSLFTNEDHIGIVTPSLIFYIDKNGDTKTIEIPEEFMSVPLVTSDGKEFWFAQPRKGFFSMKAPTDNTQGWTLTRDVFAPNASNVLKSTAMAFHQEYGMLINNHGNDRNFPLVHGDYTTLLTSGLKDMRWTSLSPTRTDSSLEEVITNPLGLAIDPMDKDKVYCGSMQTGMLRISLSDPTDMLHMSNPQDPTSSLPSFVKIADKPAAWTGYGNFCYFCAPEFDSNGTLWTAFFDLDKVTAKKEYPQLWYWTGENRLASKDAASFRPWGKLKVPNASASTAMIVKPLAGQNVRNVVLFLPQSPKSIFLIDHKGTLDNTTDDVMVEMNLFTDQDGNTFELPFVRCVYEDTATGLVWVGTEEGIFTFNPVRAFSDPTSVSRIKVARNDGTDLADYLLDNAKINSIAVDGAGRKWFATTGGVVVTSADGRSIVNEFSAENSELPDNIVYGLCYNPEANSMMMSTDKGLAEYFLSSSQGGEKKQARAYPNPVRPEYFGYVTIDGLEDDTLVKITDSSGSLVKELDRATTGETKWDVTDHNHRRVPPGVYYVLASGASDGSGWSSVSKILVVN